VANYAQHVSEKSTPQTEPVPGKVQVENSAGGYVFQVGDFDRLKRFLILGAEGGTYYASERKLTIENAQCVLRCMATDAQQTVSTIALISGAGRAPKNDAAIFALSLVAGKGDEKARKLAHEAMPAVLRIPTHLFQFVTAVTEFRGWGPSLRKAIANWYEKKSDDQLAYHVVKYQNRGGWGHRDLLRLAHPHTYSPVRQAIYRWAVAGKDKLGARQVIRKLANRPDSVADYHEVGELPRIIRAFDEAKTADVPATIKLIREDRLPWECIKTEHLNSPEVWEALLEESMPLTAMIGNLARMTSVGLIKPLSNAAKVVTEKLGDAKYLKESRVHPISILMAQRTYAQGRGEKGKLTWAPVQTVIDALNEAFYAAFGNVEPAGKRTLLAVDISGSMDSSKIAGTSLTAREAAAAIAMVIARTEPNHAIYGFATNFMQLEFSPSSRLDDVMSYMRRIPMGNTDCALPMQYARKHKIEVDTFITLTDSETWDGITQHPFQALQTYRKSMGIQARGIVAAFTSTGFSIADPSDPLSLDVVGLDSAAPQLMTDFSAGRV
jgi:60 kDa SS-A/Ro ribonucleoprotein